MNPDILNERNNRTFNPDDIAVQIYGKGGLQAKRQAQERASSDEDFKIAESFVFLPRDQQYNEAVRIYTSLIQKAKDYGYLNKTRFSENYDTEDDVLHFYIEAAFIDTVYPFGLHHSMFIPTIESQATDEQKAKWLPLTKTHEIIGTYAQTEMGHGTNLRALETTATYDRGTEEFILHSPTVSSCKFWPGGLGKTSNHAVIMAQLVIDGTNHGMHAFMAQLRDIDTHKPMPGIELGDINTKFGYDVIDNGFLRFSNYRIPRTNMLMKYSQVAPDGTYTRQALPQMAYLSMLLIRMLIVLGSANDLAMAATIATRYSAVRRQTTNSKGIEPQVLDYQTQQMKLFPSIATAYALFFTGFELKEVYTVIKNTLNSGDTSRLQELHCLTACLKAYSSEVASRSIEVCRQACGGHGYSNASGIPKIYLRCVPGCTYEGENTVMYLQCARSLLKFLGMAQAEKPLPEQFCFLKEQFSVPPMLKQATSFDINLLLLAYKLNLLHLVTHVAGRMQASIYSESVDPEVAWNQHSVELVTAAKACALYLSIVMFNNGVLRRTWERNAGNAMKQVLEFYMVHNIVENSGSFLISGVLTSEQINLLSSRRMKLIAEMRPNAVSLVDGFDFPDRLLNSCLGRYDGQVYEALYDFAKSSSLNKEEVHPSFHKYIKPMQLSMKSKL